LAQLFPQWTNKAPLYVLLATLIFTCGLVGFFWYFGSPKYTDVGYRPNQPVPYSHKLHAGNLGIGCRYCHTAVEVSAYSTVPPTQTCMNCHSLILTDSEKLLKVRESWATGEPIEWIKVNKLPDYAYFNHSIHVNSGIGCISCHGNVAEMHVVQQVEPLSMGWCLDCHRDPDPHIRPVSEITNMKWEPPADFDKFVQKFKMEKQINPPTDCSACHR
jgi:hypothetical protein